MSVIDKLRKRRAYPVTIGDEKVTVRSLLESEIDLLNSISGDAESYGVAIGCGLLEEDGSAAFTRAADEDAKAFGGRVLKSIDMPTDTKKELGDKIMSLTINGPSVEKLEKNSNGTAKQDSPPDSLVP